MGARLVVIVDGLAQAAVAAACGRDAELVAVDARTALELEKAGLASTPIEAFFEPEETRAAKDWSLGLVERLCRDLDAAARREAWPDAPAAFKPFLAHLYAVRHLIDHAVFSAWRVGRVVAARPGARFAVIGTDAEPIGDDLFFLRESAWSRVAPLVLDARGAAWEPWPSAPAGSGLAARAKGALRALKRALKRLRPAPGPEPGSVVFLHEGYSAGLLAAEARRRGARTSFIEPERLRATPSSAVRDALRRVWNGMAAGPELGRSLVWDGVPLLPALAPRLEHLVASWGPRAKGLFDAALRLQESRPRAFVAAPVNWRERLVSQACRAAGTPFAVYVHGNIGMRHSEIIYYNDMLFTDLYLVNGRANADYCRATFPQATCRVEAVGSAKLDRLASTLTPAARAEARATLGLEPSTPFVVYALNCPRDYRFPQYHRMAHANLAVERAVVELFARRPRTRLFVKLYAGDPQRSPIKDVVAGLGAPNVTASHEPGFHLLLRAADAFVVDYPSTTVGEMALTDKPIYFVDALSKLDWVPAAREAVRRRCVLIESLDRLEPTLGAALDAGRLEPNPDRRYVEDYGTCASDGRSVERAWTALSGLLKP